jgi:Domain of unknown function (DUF4340)
MKIGRLIAAAIILAALGVALFYSNRRQAAQDAAAASGTMINMITLKQEDISKLHIKKNDEDEVVLNRVGPDSWKITAPKSFTADNETVSTMLYDLSPLKADRVIEEKGSDPKEYGLAPPVAELSVTSKEGKTSKLLIGDDTPTGGDAYAMVEGDPRLFALGITYKTNLNKGLNDLRDKRMLPVDFDKIIKVDLTGPKLNLTFAPEGGNDGKWVVQNPKDLRVDSSTLADVVDKLRLATMELGASDSDRKKSASLYSTGAQVATVKVTDADGASQTMQVRKNKDAYYAVSTAMDGASKVSNELGADINKSTADFRDKWLLDLRDDTPDKVELHDGPKSYFLTRNGEDWWSDGKKMDSMSVENFLGTVRTLEAAKFVTTGFSNPTIAMTVTSNDGKRIEKVQISKSGNDYIGKREGSPLLYEVDRKGVQDMEKSLDLLRPAAPEPARK